MGLLNALGLILAVYEDFSGAKLAYPNPGPPAPKANDREGQPRPRGSSSSNAPTIPQAVEMLKSLPPQAH